MKISVCIPAFNRASLLSPLLDSVLAQDFGDFNIVVSEDCSPERTSIRKVIDRYQERYPEKIRYSENENNLGYDANLRHLLEVADGEFVVFMGNDDLMCEGALSHINDVLTRNPRAAIYLRSYAAFDENPEEVVQEFRYFDREIYFPPGEASIATVYRRSVVIPGMGFHRQTAISLATSKFDGTLLYQLYLVAEILTNSGAVFSPVRVALYRNGGTPDFGNSAAEKGRFQPRVRTPESSIIFVEGMLDIAREVELERGVMIFRPILRDLANYAYPLLSVQADKAILVFVRYGLRLASLGVGRYPIYWVYFVGIILLGVKKTDSLIKWIKRRLGRTPILGNIYQGESS